MNPFEPEGTEGATRGEKVHEVELFGEGDGDASASERQAPKAASQSLPLRDLLTDGRRKR